jgi:hypothetical protein
MSSVQVVAPSLQTTLVMRDELDSEDEPTENAAEIPLQEDSLLDLSSDSLVLEHNIDPLGGNGLVFNKKKMTQAGDSVYSAILSDRMARLSIKNLHGDGESTIDPKLGNFYSSDDARISKATLKSYFGPKQNVTFSFNPSTLMCSNCSVRPPHHILNETSAGACTVFVLADQTFPAVLPAMGASDCINIIRVENGTVNEMARLFVDVFTGAQVRVGSLILIHSVSHLAAVGTATYAESLVVGTKFILTSFGGKVTVRPGVPVLLGGLENHALSRSLEEVAAWTDGLSATKENQLKNTRAAFVQCMHQHGEGIPVPAETFTFQLPVGLQSFEKHTFVSKDWSNIYKKFGLLTWILSKRL